MAFTRSRVSDSTLSFRDVTDSTLEDCQGHIGADHAYCKTSGAIDLYVTLKPGSSLSDSTFTNVKGSKNEWDATDGTYLTLGEGTKIYGLKFSLVTHAARGEDFELKFAGGQDLHFQESDHFGVELNYNFGKLFGASSKVVRIKNVAELEKLRILL